VTHTFPEHRGATRIAVALLVVLVTSGCFIVIRTTEISSPLLYAGMRALVAGVFLLAVAGSTRRALPPKKAWPWLLLLGLTGTTVGLGGMFLAANMSGAAIPGVLANSQALIIAPAAALLFHEKLGLRRLLGLLLGWSGLAWVISAGSARSGDLAAAGLALAAASGTAAANLVMKRIGPEVDPISATAWQFTIGAVALLGASFLFEHSHPIDWNSRFIWGLAFLSLVGSAGTSWTWYRLVCDGDLISLNSVTLLTPILALLLGVVFLREWPNPQQMSGALVAVAGAAWAAWPRDT